MSRSGKSPFSVISVAIFGLVVGFIAALLLAPKSGKAVRDRFWKLVDEAEESLDEELKDRGIS